MTAQPKLLRIPNVCHGVEELLGTAKQLNLVHVVLLATEEEGKLVFLTTDLSTAEANFMLDKIKVILLTQDQL